MEPRSLLQTPPNHTHSKSHQSQLLHSRELTLAGTYQLVFSHHVQLLPIRIAAEELRAFWNGVMIAANAKWQTADPVLPISLGNLHIVFESGGDADAPLDWTAIVFLASFMKDRVCVGGGWAGFFEGTVTNLATRAVMRVTLRYVGQVL